MKEKDIITKILGDFTNELISYLEKNKVIKNNGGKNNIERWAEFVKNDTRWKRYHTKFLNEKYSKAYKFIKELSKTKEGQQKIVEMYNIKNIKGYPKLLNKLQ
ncbi:hypothetical protein HYU23_01220 [Candidatus Woesearchaeota archaeon]|nr:hypothetical protein [Candidatus Woesearchaeota archaeon]